jgi:hypothetical protein
MRFWYLIFLLAIISCGPKIDSKRIKFNDIDGYFVVQNEKRGASSSNSYKVYYIDNREVKKYIFYSYSGTSPKLKIKNNIIVICTNYEDNIKLYFEKIMINKKYFTLRHVSSFLYSSENC